MVDKNEILRALGDAIAHVEDSSGTLEGVLKHFRSASPPPGYRRIFIVFAGLAEGDDLQIQLYAVTCNRDVELRNARVPIICYRVLPEGETDNFEVDLFYPNVVIRLPQNSLWWDGATWVRKEEISYQRN